MATYNVQKSRALKRKLNKGSDTSSCDFEPPDKLLHSSLTVSTSDSECLQSEDSRVYNECLSRAKLCENKEKSPAPKESSQSGKSPLMEKIDDNSSEYSVSSVQSDFHFDSLSEYDSDEKNEIEENFRDNCTLQPSDFENDDTQERQSTLHESLREWANDNVNNVTRSSLNELLTILRNHGHSELPKFAETLLRTRRTNGKVRNMKSKCGTDGSYIYSGIKTQLENISFPEKCIKLLVNIDGLPLYKKSSIQLWPILVQILQEDYYCNCKPCLIGMFCGNSKPASAEEFLQDFVEECCELLENGIEIKNVQYTVEIVAFVCDTPARSYLKCTKSHTGFYSCERCEVT